MFIYPFPWLQALNIDRVMNFPFPTSPPSEALEVRKLSAILDTVCVKDKTIPPATVEVFFFFSFSCHLGCREASDQPWSSVSGRNKTRGSCLGSHHYPWEDHGPVSRCSKICQDAVLGETTWLSTLRYCHCGYPECEGILLFLCHPSLAS